MSSIFVSQSQGLLGLVAFGTGTKLQYFGYIFGTGTWRDSLEIFGIFLGQARIFGRYMGTGTQEAFGTDTHPFANPPSQRKD